MDGAWGAGTFLAELPVEPRAAFVAAGTLRRHRRGATVLVQGDVGDTVLLVVEGRLKVVVITEDGRELVLAVRGAGELLGELTAVAEASGPRSATVVAIDDVVVRALSGAAFRQFLLDHPAGALVLLRSVVGRLHEADRQRVEFGSLDVAHRLARLLLVLGAQHGTPAGTRVELGIALSQDELAGMQRAGGTIARRRATGAAHEEHRRGHGERPASAALGSIGYARNRRPPIVAALAELTAPVVAIKSMSRRPTSSPSLVRRGGGRPHGRRHFLMFKDPDQFNPVLPGRWLRSPADRSQRRVPTHGAHKSGPASVPDRRLGTRPVGISHRRRRRRRHRRRGGRSSLVGGRRWSWFAGRRVVRRAGHPAGERRRQGRP